MSSNRLEFMRLANERRVHWEELAEYTKRFKDLPEDEAEPIIRQCIEEIDKKYPMQSKEDYLREMNDIKNWGFLSFHYKYYWHSYEEVLEDAVRLKLKNTIIALAPHYSINHEEFLKKLINNAPDDDIRELLKDLTDIPPESRYADSALCILENNIGEPRNGKRQCCYNKVISFSPYLQSRVWRRYFRVWKRGTPETLNRYLYEEDIRPKKDDYDCDPFAIRCEGEIRGMGYTASSDKFIRHDIPEAWYSLSYLNDDATEEELFLTNMTAFMVLLKYFGWKVRHHWFVNEFGSTGYSYVVSARLPEKKRKRLLTLARKRYKKHKNS